MYRAMLRTRERAERTDSKETLDILYDLACCLIKQNKRKEAIPYAKRAVLGYQQVIGIHESRTKDAEKMLEDLQPKK